MFIHSGGTAAVFTWVKIGGRMVGGLIIVYTAGAVTMPENKDYRRILLHRSHKY